jgi:hypothetical protein
MTMSRSRTTTVALIVAVVLASSLCACDVASPRVTSCGPPLLVLHIGSSSRPDGSCAGQYGDLGWVRLKVGDTITADIPRGSGSVALPQSDAPAIVTALSRSANGRHERFRAVAPGAATLVVRTPFCSPPNVVTTPTPSSMSAAPRVLCRVLHINVV